MSIYVAARNRKHGRSAFGVAVVLLASFLALVRLSAASPLLRLQDASVVAVDTKPEIVRLVDLIRKADYDGDRVQLQILYGKLEPFVGAKDFSASVLYWRGFALWRRAINGVNDAVPGQELADDLHIAIGEFQKAQIARPGFVDARIGEMGCEMLLIYADRGQAEKVQAHIARSTSLVADIRSAASDNPRFLWLLGSAYWSSPTGAGGSQEKALEVYARGLEISKQQPTASAHSLEPTWGEPELLMNLAWSSLHKTTPDPALAEKYAQAALAIVPTWHYVRDLLLPQIVEARKANKESK